MKNMSPVFSAPDSVDGRVRNAKPLRKASRSRLRGAYLPDLLLCQFRRVMLSADDITPTGATLSYLVGHIVGVRSEKQMVRVDTRRNIAFVADHHTGRDGAVGDLPCHAMGEVVLPHPSKRAVSIRKLSGRPQDAPVWRRRREFLQPLLARPVAWRAPLLNGVHNLNCSFQAVAGQGRTSRYNANRPELFNAQVALKSSKNAVFAVSSP